MQEIHHQFFEEVAGADLGTKVSCFFFEMVWGIMPGKSVNAKRQFWRNENERKDVKIFSIKFINL